MCEDCAKVEMPCNCLPPEPDKPLPFVFSIYNGPAIIYNVFAGSGTRFGTTAGGNVYLAAGGLASSTNYSIAPLITLMASDSVVSFSGTATGVDIATDVITAPSGLAYLNTGDPVTYNNGGGTDITGLTNNTVYYLIKLSATTFRLATTAVNAFASVYINLTVVGTGTQTITGIRATATVTINASGDVSGITITNAGSGYQPLQAPGYVTITIAPGLTNTINLLNPAQWYNTPVAKLALPPPPGGGAGITLGSAKCIFKLAGFVETSAVTNFTGQFYQNGIAIGNLVRHQNTADGNKTKIVHYTTPISFNYSDTLTYKITSTGTALVNFTGDILYFVQYV